MRNDLINRSELLKRLNEERVSLEKELLYESFQKDKSGIYIFKARLGEIISLINIVKSCGVNNERT